MRLQATCLQTFTVTFAMVRTYVGHGISVHPNHGSSVAPSVMVQLKGPTNLRRSGLVALGS